MNQSNAKANENKSNTTSKSNFGIVLKHTQAENHKHPEGCAYPSTPGHKLPNIASQCTRRHKPSGNSFCVYKSMPYDSVLGSCKEPSLATKKVEDNLKAWDGRLIYKLDDGPVQVDGSDGICPNKKQALVRIREINLQTQIFKNFENLSLIIITIEGDIHFK